MLRLHYFSDNPALVVEDDEESVYSIELIKEFEAVGRAWKAFLANWLLKGAGLLYARASLFISLVDTFHWQCSLNLKIFQCFSLDLLRNIVKC